LMRRSVEPTYYQVTIRFLICNHYCSFFCLIFTINNSVVSNRKRNWLRTICVIQYSCCIGDISVFIICDLNCLWMGCIPRSICIKKCYISSLWYN
jgi:hypothetical protein